MAIASHAMARSTRAAVGLDESPAAAFPPTPFNESTAAALPPTRSMNRLPQRFRSSVERPQVVNQAAELLGNAACGVDEQEQPGEMALRRLRVARVAFVDGHRIVERAHARFEILGVHGFHPLSMSVCTTSSTKACRRSIHLPLITSGCRRVRFFTGAPRDFLSARAAGVPLTTQEPETIGTCARGIDTRKKRPGRRLLEES